MPLTAPARVLAGPVLLLAMACSATAPVPATCRVDAECPADARCHQSTCTADVPPLAAIAGPRAAAPGAALVFDGASSSDADDDIVAYTWSVRVLSAACAPDLGPGNLARFQPQFACEGEFEVILVVRDRLGIVSEPAILPVKIAPP